MVINQDTFKIYFLRLEMARSQKNREISVLDLRGPLTFEVILGLLMFGLTARISYFPQKRKFLGMF